MILWNVFILAQLLFVTYLIDRCPLFIHLNVRPYINTSVMKIVYINVPIRIYLFGNTLLFWTWKKKLTLRILLIACVYVTNINYLNNCQYAMKCPLKLWILPNNYTYCKFVLKMYYFWNRQIEYLKIVHANSIVLRLWKSTRR